MTTISAQYPQGMESRLQPASPNGRTLHRPPCSLQLPTILGFLSAFIPLTTQPFIAHASRAIINSDKVLVIDGQKIFPIGFTMPPPPDGKTRDGKNGIAELASAGATFLRTGGAWTPETIAREQKYLDAAARYGMHCLPFLRENAAITSPHREQQLRQLILRFRNHPGLGAWKGDDEPEWTKKPVEPLLRGREIIRELDPNHPVVLIQAPHGTVESLRQYNPTADIIGIDIYPISYPLGIHSLVTNYHRDLGLVGDYTRLMQEVGERKMPVWMVLQISYSGVLKPGKTLRMPTFAEERFMTYEAIIAGARGFLYFGGNNEGAMSAADRKLGWNWSFWYRVLKPVIQEIGSKSPLYPALVGPDAHLAIAANAAPADREWQPNHQQSQPESPTGLNIEFCAREVGKDLFLLACKRGGTTAKVEFSGLPQSASTAEVLYESPRTVHANDGKFTDWFAPYEVHVYRFRLDGKPGNP